MPSALTPLANLTLSSSASSVTFSSINGTYRDLILVITAQCSTASQELTYLRFNGDTTSSYVANYMVNSGGALASAATASVMASIHSFCDQTQRGQVTYQIFDYAQTNKHKLVLNRGDGFGYSTATGVGRWANTAAITTVLVMSGFSGFAAGSTFALYGVSA